MVGIPIDLLWSVALDLNVKREKRLDKKKSKKNKKQSQEQKDTKRRERVLWRPHSTWDLP